MARVKSAGASKAGTTGMTGLERTRAAIRGEPVDRIRTFPILVAPACQLTGVPQGRYVTDPEVMADTLSTRGRDTMRKNRGRQ